MKNEKWGIPYRSYVPTETLLRLHLPLSDKVQTSSRCKTPMKEFNYNPEASPEHSIGRCDGRCVLQIYIGGGKKEEKQKVSIVRKSVAVTYYYRQNNISLYIPKGRDVINAD